MHIRRLWLCATLLVLQSGSIAHATTVSEANAIPWRTANESALRALIPDKTAAENFVRDVLKDDMAASHLGDYTIADVDGNGSLEFVGTIDYSGRAFYTTLLIVYQSSSGLEYTRLHTNGASMEQLSDVIVDLAGDGGKEFLVPELLEPYAGARPVPVITHVYKLTNHAFLKMDERYADYYRSKVIPTLQRRIADLSGSNQNLTDRDERLRVLRKELDATERLIAR